MIATHSTTNYRNDLYAFLSSPPIEGFRQQDEKGSGIF